jgi:hypothetical protein
MPSSSTNIYGNALLVHLSLLLKSLLRDESVYGNAVF